MTLPIVPDNPEDDFTLAELLAAADKIPDCRSPQEQNKYARRIQKANAELAETLASQMETLGLASDRLGFPVSPE